jgi:hypothetical protein
LVFVRFVIQFHKCSIYFCCLLNTSRFWASCLSLFLSVLSFYNYTEDEDICYVIGAFKVKRRTSAFMIFSQCFA